MLKTALKYKIIRIRSKVSFIAFENRYTILELFLRKILESHREFIHQNVYKPFMTDSEIESHLDLIDNMRVGSILAGLIEDADKREKKLLNQ